MIERFGFDGTESLIFDRTKPMENDSPDDDELFEEVTLSELIAHANSMESKLEAVTKDRDEYASVLGGLNAGEAIKGLMSERAELQSRLDAAKTAVGFFMSAVRCREPWTDRCDEMRATVFPDQSRTISGYDPATQSATLVERQEIES